MFFEALTKKPLKVEIAEPIIRTHIVFLKDNRVPKQSLLVGLCNCLKWNERWADDLLKNDLVPGLLWIAS